jgi:dienelactone hydrolase
MVSKEDELGRKQPAGKTLEFGTQRGMRLLLDSFKLKGLADGEPLQRWPDLTGEGHDGVTADPASRLIYHAAEWEDGLPYVSADHHPTRQMTVGVPAGARRTFFVVARQQSPFPFAYLLKFNINNHIFSGPHPGTGWGLYKKSGAQGTQPAGYSTEWTVLCMRQNASNSITFFVDGVAVETITPAESPSPFTEFTLGPGAGRVRQVCMFDRALTDAEVARQTTRLRSYNRLSYRYNYIDFLTTPALVARKEGFKGARPLVILNHAAGFTERQFHDLPVYRSLLTALLDEGYIVAASRLTDNPATGANNWGNQGAVNANAEMFNYVRDHYRVNTDQVAMIGSSMGGLVTMLAFADGRIPLRGAALYHAVLNLRYQYDTNRDMAGAIRVAYGIAADGSNYHAKTAGHDPVLRPPSNYAGYRFRFYSAPDDTLVSFADNAGDMSALIGALATEADIVRLAGGHAANVQITTADLLAFLRRCFA